MIGGWTEPKGSREYFGSLVLGLYDKQGRLLHVGQAGTGFTRETEAENFELLKARETKKNPFANKVESVREVHFVKPELVAQIKFTEWTREGLKGGVKMRAPVFLGLRVDKTARSARRRERRGSKVHGRRGRGRRALELSVRVELSWGSSLAQNDPLFEKQTFQTDDDLLI